MRSRLARIVILPLAATDVSPARAQAGALRTEWTSDALGTTEPVRTLNMMDLPRLGSWQPGNSQIRDRAMVRMTEDLRVHRRCRRRAPSRIAVPTLPASTRPFEGGTGECLQLADRLDERSTG